MTNEFEVSRHKMWDGLRELKALCDPSHEPMLESFELALEAHLEQLREAQDAIRNKLQAFEFANKSAGELLIHAQDTIKRQRQSIGDLKTVRNTAQQLAAANYTKYQRARMELSELRKSIGSTSARIPAENVVTACRNSENCQSTCLSQ